MLSDLSSLSATPMSEFCAQCNSPDDLKKCSRCRSISYCSRECQVAHWKTHKPLCEPLSGSDGKTLTPPARSQGPQSDGKTTTSETSILKTRLSSPQGSEADSTIWGVKILTNRQAEQTKDFFVSWHFEPTHPIFRRGELCPFTALYGIPILLYSPLLAGQGDPKEYASSNQRAVYLRIEPHNGFAPLHWQDAVGSCYAIRRDKQPLSKELIETMFEFHSSLLSSVFFEEPIEKGKAPYPITPAVFQKFSDEYWQKQRENGRIAAGGDGREI